MSKFFGVRENASSPGVHPEKKMKTRMNWVTMDRLMFIILKRYVGIL